MQSLLKHRQEYTFALYCLQAVTYALLAYFSHGTGHALAYTALAIICFLIAACHWPQPVDGA